MTARYSGARSLSYAKSWSHGHAPEAGAACRDYGFGRQGYPRLICLPKVANQPS